MGISAVYKQAAAHLKAASRNLRARQKAGRSKWGMGEAASSKLVSNVWKAACKAMMPCRCRKALPKTVATAAWKRSDSTKDIKSDC